jgi:hypothetical protein
LLRSRLAIWQEWQVFMIAPSPLVAT